MSRIIDKDVLWESWIEAFRANGLLNADQLAEFGEFHYATANKYIAMFEDEGLLRRFGRGKDRKILFGMSEKAADTMAIVEPQKKAAMADVKEMLDGELTLSQMIDALNNVVFNLIRMRDKMQAIQELSV